jgi:hypothetical protein
MHHDRADRRAAEGAEMMLMWIGLTVVCVLAYWWAWRVVFPPKK